MKKCCRFLRYFKRFHRLCCSNKKIEKTNCNGELHKNNPSSIISWNIQALFLFLFPQKMENIIHELKNLQSDVICLQEVFEDSYKEQIIKELKEKYPYYFIGTMDKKWKLGEDSGILILSKYDVKIEKEILLDNFVFPDYFCSRSIIYFTIGEYNFATSHLQSNQEDVSKQQLEILKKESPFEKYILLGDLNNNHSDEIMGVEKNNDTKTWNNDILDYILPINYNEIKLNVKVLPIDITNVTDHQPIFSTITKND
tara:strand:+ start:1582 stop:2346 length:765 start_codon:yes stop_codon:yes gene_type:complete